MKLYLLILLTLLAMVSPQPGEAQKIAQSSDSKPNILIILADDLHWRDLGTTGNPDVYSPNIDQLAQDGMRLNGFFASSAVCSPMRHALYTGLYPFRSGAYPNHTKVDPDTRSVFHHLRGLGYRVGLVGKEHISPPEAFPFEEISSNPPDLSDLNEVAAFVTQDEQQPWFMVFASHHPHSPWRSGPRERYDANKLTLPSWLHDNQVTRNALADYYAEISALDEQVGSLLGLIKAAGQESNTIVWFFSEQGSQLPFGGKWSLYDNGIRVAGFVRWPGRIPPGSSTEAMVQYVDVVPTLVEIAGGDPLGSDTGTQDGKRGFDGRSFLPVLAGELSEHRQYVFAQHTTVGVYGYRDPYPSRSVRDERYKLIRNLASENEFWINGIHNHPVYKSWQGDAASDPWLAEQVKWLSHRPAVELYDLRHDAFEKNNLAGHAGYAKTESRLGKALDRWMRQQGDLGLETELNAKSHQPASNQETMKRKGLLPMGDKKSK